MATTSSISFYLYSTFKEGRDTLPRGEFSFVVDEYRNLVTPSFLVWFLREADDKALLCKIDRTTRPADIGMTLHVYDAIDIHLVNHGLLNSVLSSPVKQMLDMTGREQASDMILMRDLVGVQPDKVTLVKNAILKSNPGIVDESYFTFRESIVKSEVALQTKDAFVTAMRLFGLKLHDIPNLQEHQILDFDISSLFNDLVHVGTTADGKYVFEKNGRLLYLHKVDRTLIEKCLGVDLIYNFLDEKRLVFVQYKCQRPRGMYYPGSDSNHEPELDRMGAIPGLAECSNLLPTNQNAARLCPCPVFIKLCKREVSKTHGVPIGVYYPLCVWKGLVASHAGLSVTTLPHLNRDHFSELVRNGLIGSTPKQAYDISEHLIGKTGDHRLQLVFDETAE